jgi:hypothetical protein
MLKYEKKYTSEKLRGIFPHLGYRKMHQTIVCSEIVATFYSFQP